MAGVEVGSPVERLDDPVPDVTSDRAAGDLDMIEDAADTFDVPNGPLCILLPLEQRKAGSRRTRSCGRKSSGSRLAPWEISRRAW